MYYLYIVTIIIIIIINYYLRRGRAVNLPLIHCIFSVLLNKKTGDYSKKLVGGDNALLFEYPAKSEHMNRDEQQKKHLQVKAPCQETMVT